MSLPVDSVTQVGSKVFPRCSVAMPRPEPPVRRHRYKPGKRERQERREQKAAEKAAWTAWKAAQPWRPRPVTVYGGAHSSDSRDAMVAWDAEPSESEEEVPLEAEHPDDMTGSPMARDQADETPVKAEDTDSEETVLVEAEDPPAEDIADEGADILQPRTPPAAVATDNQMDGANDLAMQNAQPGVAEAEAEPPQPGWLFSEETLQLAAAHGIQSAVVDGREVLLPRPKRRPATMRQAPAMDYTPCSAGIPDPSPDPSPVLNMVVSDMEGEAVQSEAVCPLPGGSDKRCSRWPGWKYSRPALNHDGSTRRWRTSLIAVNLRRPWSYNWRKLFREMNCTWQLLSTSTVHAAWRLACGYRHAFSRRRWPQIQAKLAGITGHPKCESIRRLIRAHQRLEERHRPLQSSAVRAYLLEPATMYVASSSLGSCPPRMLITVTGRRPPPSLTFGTSLARVQGPGLQESVFNHLVVGRPMPRPLPGTTPLKAAFCFSDLPDHPCMLQPTDSLFPPGLCQALGSALRPCACTCTSHYFFPQEHGICVVFLPSPRCQVCYRPTRTASHASAGDHWTTGSSLTKSSCHDFLTEIPWRDAHPDFTDVRHLRLSYLQVRELSTSPSNKIGPWRVPGTAQLDCSQPMANAHCAWSGLRLNALTVKTLSRTIRRTGSQAHWRCWTSYPLQPRPHRPCWGQRTRSKVYATRLPVRFLHYAMTRRQRARRHKPTIAHTSSYVSSHLGPKSQGLAIHMTLQLLRYLYQQPAVSHCEVEPRVGGISQLPLRPSVARFCDSFGKPRPERIKAYISLYHTSPRSLLSVKADTRVPALNMHLFSGCNFLRCRLALPISPQTNPHSPCMPMPQHSSSTVPITVPSYPSICSIRLSATPSRLLFLTILMRSICPALTHPMQIAPTADSCRVSQAPTRIHKRSYKRAIARAAQSQHGGTIYKGRWCTLRGLSQQYLPQAQTSSASTRSARVRGPQPTGPHVRFLSLNCGGLSQDLYVELLKALEAMPAQTQPQIVALQETHWSSDSAQQYTTGAWQVVQSHRHDNRSAGVMFLVHRSLTQHAVLSFGEPFPGRILHVRITAKGWALDCVNVYQQTMNWQRPAKDAVKPGEPKSPTAYEIRQQVWTSLHQTLTKLPHRHTLLLLGDFNTPMQQHERAGPRVANWNSRLPSDASRLTHLLEDHDLIHLNSWSKRMGPTFVWGETRTLIDHVFTRCENADSLARYTGRDCLRVGEWRKGGKHIPLSGTIHLRRFAALNRMPQPHKTGWDKSTLLQLVREPEDPRAYALVAQVQDAIGKCSTVQDINDCLVQAASTHAPAGAQATANAPWQMATLDTSVKDMWQHYRQWKAAARGTTATIWKVWFHYARFQRAHRAFQSAGRFAKKQWYQGRLDELNKHARRHDVRALYQGVRTLAPKSRRVHVQLRDKDGHVITPAEQATLLQCHYEAVYTGLQPQPTRSTQMPALQITEEQLERALSLMPTHKAVPCATASCAAGCMEALCAGGTSSPHRNCQQSGHYPRALAHSMAIFDTEDIQAYPAQAPEADWTQ